LAFVAAEVDAWVAACVEARRALLIAGVLRLAAELTLALATAPSRNWAWDEKEMPKDAITRAAMIERFILTDF